MESSCLLFTAPGQVRPGRFGLPEPGPDEALVRTVWSCISPGTETRCLAGRQFGAPPFPFIPGYSLVGVVERAGATAGIAPGTIVFCGGTAHASVSRCWGGHVGAAVARAAALVPIPTGVDLRAASMAKLAAIARHGVVRAAVQPGETVLVIGLGPIGRLAAELHAALGARVYTLDVSADRRAAAEASGLRAIDPGTDADAALRAALPEGADIVVDATGAPSVLPIAARALREVPWDNQEHPPRRLVIQGSYAAPPPLPYDELFMRDAVVLVARDCLRADMEAVLELMRAGRLPADKWVADAGGPENAPGIYPELTRLPGGRITSAFRWNA